jgi:hypothetical protein
MTEAEERQGETEQSVASTSGFDGTVQRLRELRVSDRPCVTHIFNNMMQGAQTIHVYTPPTSSDDVIESP